MPSNLQPANPVDVMPAELCRQFSEELSLEALINSYPDGSSDRLSLQTNVRRYFKMATALPAANYAALRTFYNSHLGQAFYFYNLRETVPPYTWDGTGNATVGRYTVVFDGQWSDNYGVARTAINIGLREVA